MSHSTQRKGVAVAVVELCVCQGLSYDMAEKQCTEHTRNPTLWTHLPCYFMLQPSGHSAMSHNMFLPLRCMLQGVSLAWGQRGCFWGHGEGVSYSQVTGGCARGIRGERGEQGAAGQHRSAPKPVTCISPRRTLQFTDWD